MTPQRVTLTTLGVESLDRAKAFYSALGWTAHPSDVDTVVFYQMHGAVLGLFPKAELAKEQGRPEAELGTGGMTLCQNFPDEAGVDALFAKALAAGARELAAPKKVFWGGYSGYFADPDGHVWEVAMNPFWPLAEDGALTLPEKA